MGVGVFLEQHSNTPLLQYSIVLTLMDFAYLVLGMVLNRYEVLQGLDKIIRVINLVKTKPIQ